MIMDESNPIAVEKQQSSRRPNWSLKKKLLVISSVLLVILALAVGLGVGLTRHHGSSDDDSDNDDGVSDGLKRTSKWQPKAGVSWQIILTPPITLAAAEKPVPDVEVWDLDVWENTADAFKALQNNGKKVICYFSAGSYEDWRPDKDEFDESDIGNGLDGWPGEFWLNVSSPKVHSIMSERIKMAASKGCDAIDPDNVDGYENDNGMDLTEADAVDFVKFLSAEAAKYNMSVGLKNAGAIISSVLPYVAFSVNEQCVEFEECSTFSPFVEANKPVFNIEYPEGAPNEVPDSKRADICSNQGPSEGATSFSHIIKEMDLNGWSEYCDGKIYTTTTKGSSN